MKKSLVRLFSLEKAALTALLYLALALAPTNKTEAFEYSYLIYSGIRFDYDQNSLDSTSAPPSFSQNFLGGNLLAGGYIEMAFSPYVKFNLYADLGELAAGSIERGGKKKTTLLLNEVDLLPTDEEQKAYEEALKYCREQAQKQNLPPDQCADYPLVLRESLFIRELNLTFYFHSSQWVKLDVGILSRTLARALLLDNYVLGLHFEMDWRQHPSKNSPPLKLELDFFLPDSSFTPEGKKTPTVNGALSYYFGEKSYLKIFTTYLYDGDNWAGQQLLSIWQELFTKKINQLVAATIGEKTNFSCQWVPTDKELEYLEQTLPANLKQYATSLYIQMCEKLPSSRGHHLWWGVEGEVEFKKKFKIEGAVVFYYSQIWVGLPQGTAKWRPVKPSPRNPWIRRMMGRNRPDPTQRGNPPHRRPPNMPQDPIFPQVPDNTSGANSGDTSNQDGQSDTDASASNGDTTEEKELFIVKETPIQIFGLSAELKASYYWHPKFYTALFFLTATGSSFQSGFQQNLNIFMGISPQLRYTDIFFNGGINSYSSQRGLSVSGIFSRGYITPGIEVAYSDEDTAEIKAVFAAHWAYAPPPTLSLESKEKAGTFYGAEINLNASYQLFKWLTPVLQVDFFFPGNFFAQVNPPPVNFQIIAGFDLSWWK